MQKRLRELRVLKNKIVLITGGSSGIGEATAYEAAKRGAIVVVCARHLDQLELVAKRCLILSGRPAFAYQLDVADPDQIDDVLETINHEVGSVDILVNAAGFGDMQADVKETLPTMDKMVRVNLLALMYISRCTAKQMMSKGRGVIINIGSIAGKIPTPNSGVYSATKAGVINYDNVLRMELYDYGIQVITVNPGPVDTHFFLIKQIQKGTIFLIYQAQLSYIQPSLLVEFGIVLVTRFERSIFQDSFLRFQLDISYSLELVIG